MATFFAVLKAFPTADLFLVFSGAFFKLTRDIGILFCEFGTEGRGRGIDACFAGRSAAGLDFLGFGLAIVGFGRVTFISEMYNQALHRRAVLDRQKKVQASAKTKAEASKKSESESKSANPDSEKKRKQLPPPNKSEEKKGTGGSAVVDMNHKKKIFKKM